MIFPYGSESEVGLVSNSEHHIPDINHFSLLPIIACFLIQNKVFLWVDWIHAMKAKHTAEHIEYKASTSLLIEENSKAACMILAWPLFGVDFGSGEAVIFWFGICVLIDVSLMYSLLV